MRVLAVEPGPHFSVADVHRGWTKGLRAAGAQVASLNLGDRVDFYVRAHLADRDGQMRKAFPDRADALRVAAKGIEAACYEWWPDVVLVTSGFFLPPETYDLMRDRGHTVVLVVTEAPYEDDRDVAKASRSDWVIVNDPTNLEAYQAANPNAYWQPACYDPDIHHDRGRDEDIDFGFVGTGYPSRVRFFEQVDWGAADVLLAGNWLSLDADSPLRRLVGHNLDECLDNTETAGLYRRVKASANLYRREATATCRGWAVGPREVELAACGTFFLRDRRAEGDRLFPTLPTFDGPDDFSCQLARWLDDDDLRRKAADEARAAVDGRTFTDAAQRLLNRIE